jgi:hypothetical protein
VLRGQLQQDEIEALFNDHGLDVAIGARGVTVINSQGGAVVLGSVDTRGGDFIGRDQVNPP